MGIVQDPTHPRGVSGPQGGALSAAQMRKADAALALRQKHVSWQDIAEQLGYPSPRHAIVAVERALAAGLDDSESKDFMRMLAGKKLEELIYSAWQKATDDEHPEHLQAIGKVRELIADHAKLFGYVAPMEVSIYNPSQREIDEFVGTLMKDKVPQLEQGDIFEMEEDEDGVFVAPGATLDDF